MGYTKKYSKPYPGGYVNRPSKTTLKTAEILNMESDTFEAVEEYLANTLPTEYVPEIAFTQAMLGVNQNISSAFNNLQNYSNKTFGYSLALTIDPTTYVMEISLKNKAGTVLDTKTIDFPIESMVVGVSYASGTLTLTLQNGQEVEVDISDIVRGLVSTSFKIAGIDMQDDITKEELLTALGLSNVVKTVNGAAPDADGNVNVSGGKGTSSYPLLTDKPTLNGIEIVGDKQSADYDIINHGYIGKSALGEEIELTGTTENPFNAITIYGKSKQVPYDEDHLEPSQDYPQEINVPGWVCKGNQLLDCSDLDTLRALNSDWTWTKENTATKNGITVVCNEDGTFLVNGTASESTSFIIENYNFQENEKYCLTSGITENRNSFHGVLISSYSYWGYNNLTNEGSVKFTASTTNIIPVKIIVYSQRTANNLLFKPMLQKSSDTENWKPHPFEPFGSGVNLFDGLWTQGYFNESGDLLNTRVISTTPIPCFKGDKFVIDCSGKEVALIITNTDSLFFEDSKNLQSSGFGSDRNNINCNFNGFLRICVRNSGNSNIFVSDMQSIKVMLTLFDFSTFPYSPYMADGGNVRKFNLLKTKILPQEGNPLGNEPNVLYELPIPIVRGDEFTFSTEKGDNFDSLRIEFYDINKKYISYYTLNDSYGSQRTIYIDAYNPARYMLRNGNSRQNIMASYGNTAKPYVPYRLIQRMNFYTLTGLPAIPLPDSAEDYTYIYNEGKKWLADTIEYDGEKVWWNHKVGYINQYNGESITTPYISTTGQLSTGAEIRYALPNPYDEEITDPDIVEAVKALYTNSDYTAIETSDYNDMTCHQRVDYFIDKRTAVEKRADSEAIRGYIDERISESITSVLGGEY